MAYPGETGEGTDVKKVMGWVLVLLVIGVGGAVAGLLFFPAAEPLALVDGIPDGGAVSTPAGAYYTLDARMSRALGAVLLDNERMLWQPPVEEMDLFATAHLGEDYPIWQRGEDFYLETADGGFAKLDAEALRAVFEDPTSSTIYGAEEPPALPFETAGEEGQLEPYGYRWEMARLFDTLHFDADGDGTPTASITLQTADELVLYPDERVEALTLTLTGAEGEWHFTSLDDFHAYGGSGSYTLRIDCDCGDRGTVWYLAALTLGGEPSVTIDRTEARLGEMLTLTAAHLAEESEIAVETNLRYTPRFVGEGETRVALAPISYFTQPGDDFYIDVTIDGEKTRFDITVLERTFEVQQLTVDADTVADTVGSADASEEFNRTIEPLMSIYDPVQYWTEPFILPIEITEDRNIWVSTEYGLTRYTNGSSNGTRHDGVDLAVKRGTPVVAPNAGRVIYAGNLQMTGNTVLIEHGYGLKTWFYHMDSLTVETGERVEQGQQIGTVGSTGFSTGPHLHLTFSVRQTYLDPFAFIERPAGL